MAQGTGATVIELAYLVLLAAPVIAAFYLGSSGAKARDVAAALVFGWLFLPLVGIKFAEGIPLYDKALAIGLGALLGVLIGRPGVLWALRPSWIDVPIIVWCLAPIASSLSNDLGLYDGLAAAFRQTVVWGVPYAVGRAVFGNREGMYELGRMLLIGGAVYFPLVLFESRMAPQLHLWVYGVHGRVGWETANFWGPLRYKPSVFLESNLEPTPLMGAAALCGLWLWKTGRLRQIGQIGAGWIVGAAALACLLGKSLGGFSLTVAGGGVLFLSRKFQSKVFLAVLLAVAPVYMITRASGMWSGQNVVDFLKENVSERRAGSFDTRLVNEDQLFAKAMERPVFGWGGWGRGRVYDDDGKDISLTDGMWVIAAGGNGMVGLIALYGSLLLPVAMVLWRADGRTLWGEPAAAGVFVLMVMVVMHSIDFLANAMPNPVYFAAAGGLANLAVTMRQLRISPLRARESLATIARQYATQGV